MFHSRRRLVKRLYIPLPDAPAREDILGKLLKQVTNSLTPAHLGEIAAATHGKLHRFRDEAVLIRFGAADPI